MFLWTKLILGNFSSQLQKEFSLQIWIHKKWWKHLYQIIPEEMIADIFPTLFLCIWQLSSDYRDNFVTSIFRLNYASFLCYWKLFRNIIFGSFNSSVTFTYKIIQNLPNYFSIFGYLSCFTYFKFLYFNNWVIQKSIICIDFCGYFLTCFLNRIFLEELLV